MKKSNSKKPVHKPVSKPTPVKPTPKPVKKTTSKLPKVQQTKPATVSTADTVTCPRCKQPVATTNGRYEYHRKPNGITCGNSGERVVEPGVPSSQLGKSFVAKEDGGTGPSKSSVSTEDKQGSDPTSLGPKNTKKGTAKSPTPPKKVGTGPTTDTTAQVDGQCSAPKSKMEPATAPSVSSSALSGDKEQPSKSMAEGEQRPDPTIHTKTQTTPARVSSVKPKDPGVNPVPDTSPLSATLKELVQPTDNAPHVEVQALAGTGKTTTVVEGMAVVKGVGTTITPSGQQAAVWEQMRLGRSDSIRFCAFGNAIASTLEIKLEERGLNRLGCEASTLHKLGFAAFRKQFGYRKPSSWAVQTVIGELMGSDVRQLKKEPGRAAVIKAIDELVSYCKQGLADPTPENLDLLATHFDVDLNGSRGEVYDLVPKVLEACKKPRNEISFDDMIWLPVTLGLPVPKADVLIIDESQDLNRMQQELAYKAGHRIIYVGDRHQAIFGFAGADAQSMESMRNTLACTGAEYDMPCGEGVPCRGVVTLPLTVTRRCGRAIVEEARRYVPEYEAHESNPDGLVREERYPYRGKDKPPLPWEQTYAPQVQGGDFVLCRTNAPLVNQCFSFLKRKIRANILGRKIGEGLVTLVNKLDAATVPQLVGKLSDWLAMETAKEEAKRTPSETRIGLLQDKHDCILAFTEGSDTVEKVMDVIGDVFTDDKDSKAVTFSSIHKAKGQEAQRVFYLQPPGAGPREDKMQDWEYQQERNLKYVAVTRSINELVYVY